MRLDFKIGSDKKKSSKLQLVPALGFFWEKIYKTLLSMFLMAAVVLGGFVWQKSLSGAEWSAEKKQEYLDSQSKGVVFKENDFKKVIADIEMRKQGSAGDWQIVKDVFKAY